MKQEQLPQKRWGEGERKGINNWHEVNTSLDEFNCRAETATKSVGCVVTAKWFPGHQEEDAIWKIKHWDREDGRHNTHILRFSKRQDEKKIHEFKISQFKKEWN